MSSNSSRDEQTLRVAVQLAESGVLTRPAARAIDYFASHGVRCWAQRISDDSVGIVLRERWYTPSAFNALIDDDYPSDSGSDSGAVLSPNPPMKRPCDDETTWQAARTAEAQRNYAQSEANRATFYADDDLGDDLGNDPRDEHGEHNEHAPDPYEGCGAALWAMGALIAVGLIFTIGMLWANATGIWGK